jgi:hypothetical protein
MTLNGRVALVAGAGYRPLSTPVDFILDIVNEY